MASHIYLNNVVIVDIGRPGSDRFVIDELYLRLKERNRSIILLIATHLARKVGSLLN